MKINKTYCSEKQQTQEENENNPADIFSMLMPNSQIDLRISGVYGDITEEKCSEVVYSLYSLHASGKEQKLSDPEDEQSELIDDFQPIKFIISSHGGMAAEMFSVYDIMRSIRDETPIHTEGIGKVMSASILLLAAGTKGQRRIGKHCRVMLHGVVAGQHGYLADVENEFKETKFIQNMYVKALADETNMSEKYIKKLMNKKTNVYLDAEEAVKMGIADIIF